MIRIVVFAALLGLTLAQFDYCSISPHNTLCLYRSKVTGSKCMQVYPTSISETDKTTILTVHNDLRRKVALGQETRGNSGPQPAASNMREFTWDDELAAMAQTWANQCTFAHDTNRDVSRFPVGQNLAIVFSTGQINSIDWSGNINSWYNEVNNMDRTYVASFPSNPTKGVIGHYTQVVWGTTYKVGCGIIRYYDSAWQGSYPYKVYYVCNYGSAGNWLGSPVYSAGSAGTDCPTGTTPNNGLCS